MNVSKQMLTRINPKHVNSNMYRIWLLNELANDRETAMAKLQYCTLEMEKLRWQNKTRCLTHVYNLHCIRNQHKQTQVHIYCICSYQLMCIVKEHHSSVEYGGGGRCEINKKRGFLIYMIQYHSINATR